MVKDLTTASRDKLTIFTVMGHLTDFEKTYDTMTYQACPECSSKVNPEWKIKGFECKKCQKLVPQHYAYMFRALLADCSETTWVAFSRESAKKVFKGMSASEFKGKFRSQQAAQEFFKE